jgi:hypothetical protein
MKTIYSLGRCPQFKLPCVKYNFLLKESNNRFNSFKTLSKNNFEIKDYEIDDVKNMDEDEKKEIVNQMIDRIYNRNGIKRCMKVKHVKKFPLKKYLKNLKKCFSYNKNKIEVNNLYSVNKYNIKDNYEISNSNYTNRLMESQNEKKNNEQKTLTQEKESSKNNKYYTMPNKNKDKIYKINFSKRAFNYPISHEENVNCFSQLLTNKNLNTNENKLSNSIETYNNKNNKSLKLLNNSLNTISYSNKKRNIGIQIGSEKPKEKNIFPRKYLANIFGDTIEKQKRKKAETQDNELNMIYSESMAQFYRQYDKYRKNENLRGLGLTNINFPPNIKFQNLNKKINLIKEKVVKVKSIVDTTFPKVLAYLTWTKNEYENGLKKKGYKSPYKQKLNKLEKYQKYINLYLSSSIKIRSRNKDNL